MIEVLTRAAWAEAEWCSPNEPTELPVDVLAAIVGGNEPSEGAGSVAVLRARSRLVAHHQAKLVEAMVVIVDEYSRLTPDVADAMEGAVAEVRRHCP